MRTLFKSVSWKLLDKPYSDPESYYHVTYKFHSESTLYSLAKLVSVRWLWVRIALLSLSYSDPYIKSSVASIRLNASMQSLWTCTIMLFKRTCFIVFQRYVFPERSTLNDRSLVAFVAWQTMINFARQNTSERSYLVLGCILFKY